MSQSSEPKLLRRLCICFWFTLAPCIVCISKPLCRGVTVSPWNACTGLHLVKCSNFTVQDSFCFVFCSWDIRPAFIRNFIACVEAFGASCSIQTFQPRQLLMLIESLKGTFWPRRSIVFASTHFFFNSLFCWIPFRLLKCTHHFL